MEALTAKAALVDPDSFSDEPAVTTAVARSEVEEAFEAGSADLWIDVERSRNGERDSDRRITVSWEQSDLERLLASTTADPVPLAFRPEELNRMFEEPDVEAQGLREAAAVLTIALATAAGATAGAAHAMVATDGGGSGAATPTPVLTDTTSSGPATVGATSQGGAQFVTDTTNSGPGAVGATGAEGTQFVTDTTSGGPAQTAAEASGGGGSSSFVESAGGAAALAGGLVLLIAAAGFATTRHGHRPKTT